MNRARLPQAWRRAAARGVSSLIVVVILLAVMATGVVFTNRNLIVEQKTSANQYRATIAAEAAEAGLEWATAMMNTQQQINAACATSATASDVPFKRKYLDQASSGAYTPKAIGATAVNAACVANPDGTPGWSCSCPASGTAPSPAAGAPATGFQPSFAIRFEPSATTGTVRLVAYGCTSRITSTACAGDAAARVSIVLGPISALGTPPPGPLTARGKVDIGNAALRVVNPDPNTNGITIDAGAGITAPNVILETVAGTPPKSTLISNDPSLFSLTEDEMFATYFGMDKPTYRSMAKVVGPCTPCDQSTLTAQYDADVRLLWIDGDLALNSIGTIATTADPMIVVVTGNMSLSAAIVFNGLIYASGVVWDNTGGGNALLRGAAIAEGNYTGNGTPTYYYDPDVLRRLRFLTGTFVRVPGSWRDF